MKKSLLLPAFGVLLLGACTTAKTTQEQPAEQFPSQLFGQWNVAELVLNDSTVVPTDSVAAALTFAEDTTYLFETGCNAISGIFTADSANISFSEGAATMMLCPDMQVEDAVKAILPNVNGYQLNGDSSLVITAKNGGKITFKR